MEYFGNEVIKSFSVLGLGNEMHHPNLSLSFPPKLMEFIQIYAKHPDNKLPEKWGWSETYPPCVNVSLIKPLKKCHWIPSGKLT